MKLFNLIFALLISFLSYSQTIREKLYSNGRIEQCFFSPEDNIIEILSELIKQEKSHIQIAMYYLSERKIIQELIEAKNNRNIPIEVIIDNICVTNVNMKNLHSLVSSKISLKVFNSKTSKGPNPIMHNKYMIFKNNIDNKSILTTGSFNCTYTAQAKNRENLIVTENSNLISKYQQNFRRLKDQVKDFIKKRQYTKWLMKVQKIKPKYL